jgi:hypothetical protein
MMAITEDASGIILLENLVGQLQAQQAANPASFTGGQSFDVIFKAGGANTNNQLPGGTMTIASLIVRVQAVLLNLQRLPQ